MKCRKALPYFSCAQLAEAWAEVSTAAVPVHDTELEGSETIPEVANTQGPMAIQYLKSGPHDCKAWVPPIIQMSSQEDIWLCGNEAWVYYPWQLDEDLVLILHYIRNGPLYTHSLYI